jgi:hypothetical protein
MVEHQRRLPRRGPVEVSTRLSQRTSTTLEPDEHGKLVLGTATKMLPAHANTGDARWNAGVGRKAIAPYSCALVLVRIWTAENSLYERPRLDQTHREPMRLESPGAGTEAQTRATAWFDRPDRQSSTSRCHPVTLAQTSATIRSAARGSEARARSYFDLVRVAARFQVHRHGWKPTPPQSDTRASIVHRSPRALRATSPEPSRGVVHPLAMISRITTRNSAASNRRSAARKGDCQLQFLVGQGIATNTFLRVLERSPRNVAL